MKLNWGTSIVLVMIGFIGFIMFFFVKGHFVQQLNLVTEDYYEVGLDHEKKMLWKDNAIKLSEPLQISKTQAEVVLQFPKEISSKATGKVLFYRANNANLDFNTDLTVNQNQQQKIDISNLLTGSYRVKIHLVDAGKNYYWEEQYSL